jgi:hypothetical protein
MSKRIKVILCATALCGVVAAVALLRTQPAPTLRLSFSGFTNQGRVAVFILKNSSPLYDADAWLVGNRPNSLGDCQIRACPQSALF